MTIRETIKSAGGALIGLVSGAGALKKRVVRRGRTILVAAIVLGGGTALSTGQISAGSVANALADPLSILAARSPGERTPGALAQTKPDLASYGLPSAQPFQPSERVLPEIRDRPSPALLGAPGAVLAALGTPTGSNIIGGVPGPGGSGGFVPVAGSPAPPGGGGGVTPGEPTITPPGGGGGGGGGGVIMQPPSVVPEPATWASMIAGLLAIGAMMRRRRNQAKQLVPTEPIELSGGSSASSSNI